ncbi:MAG: peptidoglycan DD-metalloendopeptidase family protein [Gammaproteobacteria bacterium]|nr:peptidoglycan DD-metalloendopeptidase family protein [Gammaproteobacteria bacterium]
MSRRIARHIIAGLLAGAAALGAPARAVAADDTARGDAEARLAEVRRRIETLSRELGETRDARDSLAGRLRESELEAARLGKELAALERRRADRESGIARLTAARGALEADIALARRELERYVRAAYATGRQDRLKLLLNQENPATVSRALAYYDYFNRARARRIAALADDLERLARIERDIAAEVRELARLAEERAGALAALESERERRRGVLAELARELEAKGSRLERLQRDERELSELVARIAAEIARELADIPPAGAAESPFPSRRGRLPWPVAGELRHRFGTPRGSGDLTWQGVVIDASPGSPVHAVSHGRVAFADWLRGFGLLMIIEHGDGYMSLYGHNSSLLKEVGDWVAGDEVVASVGDSGGRARAGLYVEIRHEGAPVDPQAWCRAAPGAAALRSD